jgi:hypothetical protein
MHVITRPRLEVRILELVKGACGMWRTLVSFTISGAENLITAPA